MNILIYSAISLLASALASVILIRHLLRVCYKLRLYDNIEERKLHKTNVPRLGGIIFMPAILVGMLCALAAMHFFQSTTPMAVNISTVIIGTGMLGIYLIGIADDIIECAAWLKFLIQILAALTFPICGLYINNLYGFLGIYELPQFLAYAITVFFVVLTINAINLIDGIDGLAACLTLFALTVFGWEYYNMELPVFATLIASLAGSLIVYLPYNMWGSSERGTKTFMGDSGSLLLGMTLAYLTVKFMMDNPSSLPYRDNAFAVSLSALTIPCFDLIRVALCRLSRGKGIFTPDKTHIHHKIIAKGIGMHHTLCVIIFLQAGFYAINMLLNGIGVNITWIVAIDITLYTLLHIYLPLNKEETKPQKESMSQNTKSKNRLKVLHLSKYYYPYMGGLEDVCRTIIESTMEHEQMVLCFNDKNENVDETINGVRVFRIGLLREVARQPLSPNYNTIMRRIIRNYHPDIIHLHTPNPLASLLCLMNKGKNTKLVVHWHSDIIVQPLLHALFSPFERMLLKKADAIIATSPNYMEGSELLRQHRDKCTVIPNTVATSKLDDTLDNKKIEELRQKYGKFVFFVGRHVTYKGIEYLIDAAHEMGDDINVIIAGRGPLTTQLIDRAAGLSNVHFIGRIPDEELGNYLRACTVFAFPSITKNEAFGVVLAEAMHCGAVPVCFTIEGSGVNWVNINGETGIVVENGNVKAYAKAVKKLIADDELRQEYSVNAHNRVEKLFLSQCIKPVILDLYKKITGTAQCRS